jgi:hypothetical protein
LIKTSDTGINFSHLQAQACAVEQWVKLVSIKIPSFLQPSIQVITDFFNSLKPWPRLRTLRYLDLLFLTTVAALLFYLAANMIWIQQSAERWANLVLSLPIAGQYFLPFALGLGLVYLLRWFGCEHQNHKWIDCWMFPSCYISGLFLSAGVIGSYHSDFIWLDVNHRYGLGVSLACFFIGIWAEDFITAFKINKTPKTASDNSIVTDLTKLPEEQQVAKILDWVQEEKPSRKLDLFGAQAYADKISQRLEKAAKDNFSLTQAIIGPFGVGKSTIIQHTINKITESNHKWIIVKVDAWGASGSNIASIILKKVINTLSEHFDISALRSLPEQYLDSLNAAKQPHIMAMVAALRDNEPAKNKLEKLDVFLETVDRRLLIVIEDVDRHDEAEKHCNALASLLDNLRALKRTSFILAVGFGAGYDEILQRICLYHDHIRPITDKLLVKVVDTFFKRLKNNREITYIGNECLVTPHDVDYHAHDKLLILTSLIQTPRELKNILRRTQDVWSGSNLAGEVDLEELFILNAIYYINSSCFEMIFNCAINNKLPSQEIEKIEDENLRELLKHLFSSMYNKPQSINIKVNYVGYVFFRRCLFEKIEQDINKRDQSIIIALRKLEQCKLTQSDNRTLSAIEQIGHLCSDPFTLDRLNCLNKVISTDKNISETTLKIFHAFILNIKKPNKTTKEEIECIQSIEGIIGRLGGLLQNNTSFSMIEYVAKSIIPHLLEINLPLSLIAIEWLGSAAGNSLKKDIYAYAKTEFKEIVNNSEKLYRLLANSPSGDMLSARFLFSNQLGGIDEEHITWLLSLVIDIKEFDTKLAFNQLFNLIESLCSHYTKSFNEDNMAAKNVLQLFGNRVDDAKMLMDEYIETKDSSDRETANRIRGIFALSVQI